MYQYAGPKQPRLATEALVERSAPSKADRSRALIIRAELVIGCPAVFLLAGSILSGGHRLRPERRSQLPPTRGLLDRTVSARLAGGRVRRCRGRSRLADACRALQVVLRIPFLVALAVGMQLLGARTT